MAGINVRIVNSFDEGEGDIEVDESILSVDPEFEEDLKQFSLRLQA